MSVFILNGRPEDEVFTFEPDDGTGCRHFNVSAIDRWLYQKPLNIQRWLDHGIKIAIRPLPRDVIEEVILPKKLFEEERVAQLIEPYLSKPVLCVAWPGGTTVLIDGTHRFIRMYRDNTPEYRHIHLPYDFAMQFSIDLPGRGTLDIEEPRVPNDARGALLKKLGVI